MDLIIIRINLKQITHTTISRLLARDLYQEFSDPTAGEKLIANRVLHLMQKGTLGGLSAILPHRYFADDCTIVSLLYQLFRSPVFGFSEADSQYWMQRCLCEEHDGLHVAYRNRQRLLKELRDFFADIDYLSAVNRTMGAMSERGEIDAALTANRQTLAAFFQQHSQSHSLAVSQ